MRLLPLALLILLSACLPAKKESSTTTSAINAEAPYLWSNYAIPKTLRVSNDFTVAEVSNITAMSTAWKVALEDKKIFFDYGASIPEVTNSLASMDSLLDSTLGVYKSAQWPPSLPTSALAVTQIFGRRHNTGSANEFVDIEHADILVNFDNHSFDTADSGANYDLRTVILHELGHFMGLQHKSSSSVRDASVMYPSINSIESKRSPKAIDIADLAEKYNITLDSGGVLNAITAQRAPAVYQASDEGVRVKILLELHADGECIHKIDGVTTGRHQFINQD